jgi:hypothetical protein
MTPTLADVTKLLKILPTNKTNAIHAFDIATKLNLPTDGNQVETRALIRFAIQSGYLIVSNTRDGYWISNDKQEVWEYIKSLQSRADDTTLRSDELRTAWNKQNPHNPI